MIPQSTKPQFIKQSLTELTVICTTATEWEKPHSAMLSHPNST
jgi:hypothetical protein